MPDLILYALVASNLVLLLVTLGWGIKKVRAFQGFAGDAGQFMEGLDTVISGPADQEGTLAFTISDVANRMKMGLMAEASAVVRGGKSVDRAIGKDIMNATPLGGILDAAGLSELKKTLVRNPALMNFAMQKVAPMLEGGQEKKEGVAGSDGGSVPVMT